MCCVCGMCVCVGGGGGGSGQFTTLMSGCEIEPDLCKCFQLHQPPAHPCQLNQTCTDWGGQDHSVCQSHTLIF